MELLELLQQIQAQKHMNDSHFAAFLGIDSGNWSRFKSGKRAFGKSYLKKIKVAIPSAELYIADYAARRMLGQ